MLERRPSDARFEICHVRSMAELTRVAAFINNPIAWGAEPTIVVMDVIGTDGIADFI